MGTLSREQMGNAAGIFNLMRNVGWSIGIAMITTLVTRNAQVSQAASRRALETARSFDPDLILLDLIMPQADGMEVAAQITSDWMLHRVPIVFVTALITGEEARDVRRIEGHRVVPKPAHGSELIKVVEESLPKRFDNSSQRV